MNRPNHQYTVIETTGKGFETRRWRVPLRVVDEFTRTKGVFWNTRPAALRPDDRHAEPSTTGESHVIIDGNKHIRSFTLVCAAALDREGALLLSR